MKKQSNFLFIKNEFVRDELELSIERISKAYSELFSGYDTSADNVLNDVVHVDDYHGIVIVENINFYTFCKHHFLPFFGTATVSYEPRKVVTGLGKIVRLVRDVHSRRLQIQELMAKDIADDLMRILDAKGARVELTAKHLCMCSRGPSDDTSTTTVRYEAGSLKRPL